MSLVALFGLKSILSDMSMATSALFGCYLLGVSSFIPSLLSLFVSLELRWVFWRQHIIGSCFLIHQPLCVFWFMNSINLHLGWLLINENLVMPFYLLFSGCSVSLSFLSLCVFLSAILFSWFSMMFFSVSSFYMFCVSALDLSFVCIKCLIDKIVLFLLIACYLHLPIWVLSFFSSPFMLLLSQIIPFYVVSLLTNWSSYSYFYCFFSPLNFML